MRKNWRMVLAALSLLAAGLLDESRWMEKSQESAGVGSAAYEYIELAMVEPSRLLDLVRWSGARAGAETAPCQDGACVGVSGAVLRPDADDVDWQYGGDGGCIYAESGNRDTFWSAPLYLPQGATVASLTMYANDSSSWTNSRAWLSIYDHLGERVEEWQVESAGSPGMSTWSANEINHIVNHANYYYAVRWQPRELGDDMQLCGLLIDYRLPATGGAGEDDSGELSDNPGWGVPSAPPWLTETSCLKQGLPPQADLPTILPLDQPSQWSRSGARRLCLYGFPEDERIDLRLFTPDGENEQHGAFSIGEPSQSGLLIFRRLAVATPAPLRPTTQREFRGILGGIKLPESTVFEMAQPTEEAEITELQAVQLVPPVPEVVEEAQAVKGSPEAWRVGDVTVLSVSLWWPASLPSGVWIAKAEAPGAEASAAVFFEPVSGISTRPDEEINMFVHRHCAEYPPGSDIVIEGAGLDPFRDLRLGLYTPQGYRLKLIDSLWTETDGAGVFSQTHQIKSSYQDGTYYTLKAPVRGSVIATGLPCFRVSRP
jgi:hypothetical protein